MISIISTFFIILGALFFILGTVGLFRFFDLYTRLHAIAKVDNLGVGFIVFGLVLQANDIFVALKLILIWITVLISSSTIAFLLSNHSQKSGDHPIVSEKQ